VFHAIMEVEMSRSQIKLPLQRTYDRENESFEVVVPVQRNYK
jgi:hypothetical protein